MTDQTWSLGEVREVGGAALSAIEASLPSWRVRVETERRTWYSPALTRTAALQLLGSVELELSGCSDSPRTFRFTTRPDGSVAAIRGRAVVGVDLLGPRSPMPDSTTSEPANSPPTPPTLNPASAPAPTAVQDGPGSAFLRTLRRDQGGRIS